MHKTTIFIIQLCVFFELFAIKAVKHHFRLDFVTSRWVKAFSDFHGMKRALRYEVVHGKYSSLAPLIDQPKGQYSNMLEKWRLESVEIVATVRLRLDKSGTICEVVKPVLLDRCVDEYPGVAASWN